MSQSTHPFSSFGVSDALQESLEVFEHSGLAEELAPRPLEAFVEADLSVVNTFLDEAHRCFIRLDIMYLARATDGTLGLVCTDSEEFDLFVPIERFTSWHAECPKYWDRRIPTQGDADTIRQIFHKEMDALDRLLAGPGPLADEVANQDLLDRMAPEPCAWDLGVACEEEIFQVCEGMPFEIELTAQGEHGPVTHVGYVASTHRAYDGRMGFSFEAAAGTQSMPFEAVLSWRLVDTNLDPEIWDPDLAKSGGRAELEEIFAEDIDLMKGDYPRYIEANHSHPNVSWEEYVETFRLERLAEDRRERNWFDGPETQIYLAMAQTLPEGVEDVAIRVGGALWAERRGDNATRVAWARRFTGFPISDDMLVSAAAALDPADSARVQAAALFVACGGEKATPETLRRLTLMQKNCPVPRFW